MAQLPPGFVLDSAPQQGPVYGPPPEAPKPRDPLEVRKDELDIAKAEHELARGDVAAPPQGYRFTQGGNLEAIPGGPADKKQNAVAEKQRDNAAALLTAAGVDLVKGIDPVSDLIKQSTSGRIQHIGAEAVGLTGHATPGMQNIARLQTLVSDMVLQLTGGGLGNQISNADREFIVQRVGNLANPDVPADQRLAAWEQVKARMGNILGIQPAQQQGVAASQNGFSETPANDAGAFLDSLVRQGVPYSQAQAQFQQQFPGFKGPNGEPGFSPQQYKDAVLYARQHPDQPYNPTQAIERTPLSPEEQNNSALAGSTGGAFAGNFLNAATAGLPAAVTGDQGQQFLASSQARHPTASMAGDLTGSVGGMLGIEGGLARGGMKAGIGRELVANTGYGAVRGGAENPQDSLGGAGLGAAAGAGGTLAGRALAGAAASMVSPTGGKLSQLYEAGVRPTPGQRALAAGGGEGLAGLAGRAVNATEEAFQSLPIAGAAIHGARQEARDQFQIAAFNEALKDVGEQLPRGMKPGTAPHAYSQGVFNRVYDKARGGMRVAADPELETELGEVAGRIDTLAPESASRFYRILENKVLPKIQGTLEGDAYKKVQSNLTTLIRDIRGSKTGDDELASALADLQHALDNAARRHSDPEAVKLLDAADRSYAKFVRIEEAARARGGDTGTFTPTQFDRAIQKGSRGPRSREYLRGDALMQDMADQAAPLSDRMGNSFTTDRALAAGTVLTLGAGSMNPGAFGLVGALATLYAPGIRRGIKAAMKPSGPKAKALADAIRKRKRLAGAAGGAVSVSGTSPGQ